MIGMTRALTPTANLTSFTFGIKASEDDVEVVEEHEGECFTIRVNDNPCFSISSKQDECFFIKVDETVKEPTIPPEIIVPDYEGHGRIITGIHSNGTHVFISHFNPYGSGEEFTILSKLFGTMGENGLYEITLTSFEVGVYDATIDAGGQYRIYGWHNPSITSEYLLIGASDGIGNKRAYTTSTVVGKAMVYHDRSYLGWINNHVSDHRILYASRPMTEGEKALSKCPLPSVDAYFQKGINVEDGSQEADWYVPSSMLTLPDDEGYNKQFSNTHMNLSEGYFASSAYGRIDICKSIGITTYSYMDGSTCHTGVGAIGWCRTVPKVATKILRINDFIVFSELVFSTTHRLYVVDMRDIDETDGTVIVEALWYDTEIVCKDFTLVGTSILHVDGTNVIRQASIYSFLPQ